MPILLTDQRTDDWHAARKGKITASLAAACLGLDKYKGPLAAFNELTGRTKQGENKHMAWGNEYEAEARNAYECESGELVTTTGFWVHPEHAWLGASPDGLVNAAGLVEIKCPSVIPEAAPEHHVIQMAVQLAVTDRAWCDYFAWSQAGTLLKRYPRAKDFEWAMIAKLKEFYERYILPDVPPKRSRKLVQL